MAQDRIKEYYKGFQLVSAFYRNEYQSRAHHKHAGAIEARNCVSIDDAQVQVKLLVDQYVFEHKETLQNKIVAQHKNVMEKAEHNYKGVTSVTAFHRENHCYGCKRPVDNAYDVECASCNWIICSNCGACGCGYKRYT